MRPKRYKVEEITYAYIQEGHPPDEAIRKAEAFVKEIYRFDQLQAYHDREFKEHESPRPDLFPPRD